MTVATVVKTVGSGGAFSTQQLAEDGAPVGLTTAEKWNAGTFVGTFQAGETVTGVGLTAGKFLDSDGATYVTFGIVTGNSATLVTLTGSTSGATCVVSSKTDTGIIWEAQSKNQGFSVAGNVLTISGSTSSSTCYKHFTTEAGASFADNSAIALRYNTANGAYIVDTGSYSTTVIVSEDYARLSKLQIRQSTTSGGGSPSNTVTLKVNNDGCIIDRCILSSNSNSEGVILGGGTATELKNSLVMRESGSLATGGSPTVLVNSGAKLTNVTLANFGVSGSYGVGVNYSPTSVLVNVYAGGFNHGFSVGGSNPTFTNCQTSDANGFTGVTTGVAFNTTQFNNVTFATADLKIPSGSALVAAGSSSGATPDIFGTTRPQGGTWDVGCFEYAAPVSPPVSSGAYFTMNF